MLRQSGFTARPIYVSPKPEVKGADLPRCYADLRIYWTAKDRNNCMQLSLSNEHLGMVRSKKTFGLRVEDTVFQQIWKGERPNEEVPKLVQMKSRWKLTGIPNFAEAGHVQKWLDEIEWKAKVLKKIKASVWLLGTDMLPPSQTLSFNSMPLLVEEFQGPSIAASTIVAGSLALQTIFFKDR